MKMAVMAQMLNLKITFKNFKKLFLRSFFFQFNICINLLFEVILAPLMYIDKYDSKRWREEDFAREVHEVHLEILTTSL